MHDVLLDGPLVTLLLVLELSPPGRLSLRPSVQHFLQEWLTQSPQSLLHEDPPHCQHTPLLLTHCFLPSIQGAYALFQSETLPRMTLVKLTLFLFREDVLLVPVHLDLNAAYLLDLVGGVLLVHREGS